MSARTIRRTLSIWTLTVMLAAAGAAQRSRPDGDVRAGKTGDAVVEWLERAGSQGFSGSVFAARGGEVVVATGVGWADLGRKQRIGSTTLFEIASVSKPLTALTVARLAASGKLSLDDPMAKHLPGVPDDCKAITLRHLIQHTSGIPGTNSQGAGERLDAVLPTFLAGGPRHTPGQHWEYWNQGYALLSEVIARVSGKSYVDAMRTELFEPAGMASTCFTGDKAPGKLTVAIGVSAGGEPRSALDHPYGAYGFQYRGMGGVVTNVWDLWRLDRALATEALLDEKSRKELFEPGLNDYALGWWVKRGEDGRLQQSHGGRVRGFVCDVRRFPEQDGCVFVLCNDDSLPPYHVADAVEALLFGDAEAPPAPPRAMEAKTAAKWVGEYQAEGGRKLTIELQRDLVLARIEWSPPNGPVTRGLLGEDAKGRVVFFDWREAQPVEAEGKGAPKALKIGGANYQRIR